MFSSSKKLVSYNLYLGSYEVINSGNTQNMYVYSFIIQFFFYKNFLNEYKN